MPHAEDSSMPNSMVNGEQASSRFISHLTSYPVVSDSIDTFKKNPYGAKSLSLAHSASDTFIAPVLPYAEKPYDYVRPYVTKADELADSGLGHVDAHFPIVKDQTKEIQGKVWGLVGFPINVTVEVKDYLLSVWGREYKKVTDSENGGLVAAGKAAVSTGVHVGSDVLLWIGDLMSTGKKEAEHALKEKTGSN